MAFPRQRSERNSRVGGNTLDTAEEASVFEIQRIGRRGHEHCAKFTSDRRRLSVFVGHRPLTGIARTRSNLDGA